MFNRKYYEFERNNYYYGKLLTSRDFQSEQGYMNDKRRLLNRTLHGKGIVYGLDVVEADDSSIILQSGMALDASGREIVVPRTQVIKLSTIDGYQNLKTERVCLGIAYDETEEDPVYAVMEKEADSDGRRYNRLKEGFRLFLADSQDCAPVKRREDAYIVSRVLYEDEDVSIIQYLPTFLVPNRNMKGRTLIRKRSHVPCTCSFSCKVTVDGMNPKESEIRIDNLTQEYGEVMELEQIFQPENYIYGNEDVVIRLDQIEVRKSGKTETAEAQTLSIKPVYGTVLDYVKKNYYAGTLDVDLDSVYDEKLWIAQIHLIRSNNHTLIDYVGHTDLEQHVPAAEELMLLEHLHEYLIPEGKVVPDEPRKVSGMIQMENAGTVRETRSNSCGVFEMSLGNGGESGRVYFSDEIMHGLGNGPVCVEIGIEYISRNAAAKENRESIILGDGSIFASDNTVSDDKIFQLDQAVKILPNRGTFIVGVRPKVKMGKIGLRIRWYAFKPEDLEKRVYGLKDQKGCIMINPDTIVLPPKGSVHINPVFINMPEEALSYTLLDPEGGKIDNNGMYTAPAQEGVYEIKAASISDPEIYTHAFIIVSQKKSEE
jgi:hypothetical protein